MRPSPFDHALPQLQLGGKRAVLETADFRSPRCGAPPEPFGGQEQRANDQRPSSRHGIQEGEGRADMTQFNLALMAIVLPSSPDTVCSGFGIGAFIQNDHSVLAQRGLGSNGLLDLPEHCLGGPGQCAHEVLERLTILPGHASTDVGEVALVLHGRLVSPERERTRAGTSGASAKARPIRIPEGGGFLAQILKDTGY